MRSWLLFLAVIFVCLGSIVDIEASNSQPNRLKLAWLYEGIESDFIWFDDNGLTLTGMAFIGLLDDLGIDSGAKTEPEFDEARINDRLYSKALLDLLARRKAMKGGGLADEGVKLLEAINNAQLSSFIERLLPSYDEVSQIRYMIRKYKTQLDLDWPSVTHLDLTLGQSAKQVQGLRWMLTVLGDLENKKMTPHRQSIFDPVVIHGIKSFQRRHGLTVNGELDDITVSALNISPRRRVLQMQKNLWRWLMLPPNPPEKYIKVNIPDYSLQVFVSGEIDLVMKVIVGKPSSPTPMLSTRVTRMTINPYWTPPASIIHSELLPLNTREPGYLNHKGFELHPVANKNNPVIKLINIKSSHLAALLKNYRLVQSPGRDNALGKLRFTIPNTEAIYLHDTPAKKLFDGDSLALSHGCIRLESAFELFHYLLSTQDNAKEIRKALSGPDTQYISLSDPIPIFITYLTAWVDSNGKLQLRPDIYHLDGEI